MAQRALRFATRTGVRLRSPAQIDRLYALIWSLGLSAVILAFALGIIVGEHIKR